MVKGSDRSGHREGSRVRRLTLSTGARLPGPKSQLGHSQLVDLGLHNLGQVFCALVSLPEKQGE